ICGEAPCAFRASRLSHFSMTTKVSGPNLAWKLPTPSASIAGPYSMQPFSAWTAGTLARNASRICSRMPGLAVMTATMWIISGLPSGDAFKDAVVSGGDERTDLLDPVAELGGGLPCMALHHCGRLDLVERQIARRRRVARMFE